MSMTEAQRHKAGQYFDNALARAGSVEPQISNARQAVQDSTAQYQGLEKFLLGKGITQADIDTEYRADFAQDAAAIFNAAGPQLIALLAEVGRITTVSPQAALQALAAAAPSAVPTDAQTVLVSPDGTVNYVNA